MGKEKGKRQRREEEGEINGGVVEDPSESR